MLPDTQTTRDIMADNYSKGSSLSPVTLPSVHLALLRLTSIEVQELLADEVEDMEEEKALAERLGLAGECHNAADTHEVEGEGDAHHLFFPDGLEESHISIIQDGLKTLESEEICRIAGAYWCSKDRQSNFGGWWFCIAADDVQMGGTETSTHNAADAMLTTRENTLARRKKHAADGEAS